MPCTHPIAQNVIAVLCVAAVLHFFISKKLYFNYKIPLGIYILLIISTLWLGVYPISPLGFTASQIPVLKNFHIITESKELSIQPNDIISLGKNSKAIIQPNLVNKQLKCKWISVRGAALDEPDTCDVIYAVPNADYDILKLNIESVCGLPASNWQIKISILP